MVYGVGVRSEKGRCFPFWRDLVNCSRRSELPYVDCRLIYEDYQECLHRTKEKARMIEIIRRLRAKRLSAELKK